MRIAFVADCHVGNFRRMGGPMEAGLNRRGRQSVTALASAMSAAGREDCELAVVLGDLHDDMQPPPQMITAVQQALNIGDFHKRILLGNHDMFSEQPGDHALGPYSVLECLRVIETPTLEHSVLYIPFAPGDARQWLPDKVAQVLGQPVAGRPASATTLALHLGVIDEDTAPWLRASKDAVPLDLILSLCDQYNIKAVFAGNWHERKVWLGDTPAPAEPDADYPLAGRGPLVVQVGTLCPTGFDNPGLRNYGSLLIWDTEAQVLSVREIPGPRFLSTLRITNGDTGRLQSALGDGMHVYFQVKAMAEEQGEVAARIEELRASGQIVEGEVAPDDSMIKAAATEAADAASGADTLDQAIALYVEQMPVPEGVDRGAVLARVKKYMGA